MVCSFAEPKKNYETFRIIVDLATAKYDLEILESVNIYSGRNCRKYAHFPIFLLAQFIQTIFIGRIT